MDTAVMDRTDDRLRLSIEAVEERGDAALAAGIDGLVPVVVAQGADGSWYQRRLCVDTPLTPRDATGLIALLELRRGWLAPTLAQRVEWDGMAR